MKRILFLTAFLLIIGRSSGQSLEWEILGIGIPNGIQKNEEGEVRSFDRGFSLATEVRLNLMGKRISTGLQLGLTGWNRITPETYTHHNPFTFLATGDYNFQGVIPKVVPFAGMGLGYSVVRSWSLGGENRHTSHYWYDGHAAIVPRIGAEFFKRIRLTGEYQYLGNGNNFFNIKLGFVIGS
jgi:hypothetical protein